MGRGSEGQLPQRDICCQVLYPMLGTSTPPYLILIKEETNIKGDTLEKLLSWDSDPDLSASQAHSLSSMQATSCGEIWSGAQGMIKRPPE